MIEHTPRVAREFHVGPAGDRWALTRDLRTGQPYVLHRATRDEPDVELDLGSFLVLFQGQEREDLLQLIGSLLPDDGTAIDHRSDVDRPPRFLSRWMPSRHN